jgi:hypothetical protein
VHAFIDNRNAMIGRINSLSCMVKQHSDTRSSNLFDRPVRECPPVLHFTRDIEWKPANAVVGETVGNDYGYLTR